MRRLVLVLAAVTLVAFGCSDDGDDGTDEAVAAGATDETTDDDTTADDTTADDTTADDTTGDTTSDEAAGDEATVALADTSLGEVLAGPDGRTLYLFTGDSDGTSACIDQCAEVWPPLVVSGEPVAGDGLDETLLGTIERSGGSQQVTYADHPLYYYAPDTAPGDVNGQGVNDVWFVVDAAGEAVAAS